MLHGHARLTADIDIVVDLTPDASLAAVRALSGIGMRPRAPVPLTAFADPAMRTAWVRDKAMAVFSLWDPSEPMREVDLFLEHPMPFDDLFGRSVEVTLDDTCVRIASLDDLIDLKRLAGRPLDLVQPPPSEDAFGSFAETRMWRLELTLAATPAARLRWLEEAIRLATRSGALPKPR